MVRRTKNKSIIHKQKQNNILRFSAISLFVIFSFFTLPTVNNFLIKNLLQINGVTGVFLGEDFFL